MPKRQPGPMQEPLTAVYRGCALTVAVLLVISLATSLVVFLVFQTPRPVVTVPNLVGKQSADALAAARQKGLVPTVDGSRYDDNIPAGAVCSTEPPPGRDVRKGRAIRLFISRGPRNSLVPNLVGGTVSDAREALEARGLVVGEVWSKRSDEKVGTVVSQSTSPRAKVAAGTRINLQVSGGPDFGVIHVPGQPDHVFRTVILRMPDDGVQHHVLVKLDHNGTEQVVHDRMYPPKERAEIDISGEVGDEVIVELDDRTILMKRL